MDRDDLTAQVGTGKAVHLVAFTYTRLTVCGKSYSRLGAAATADNLTCTICRNRL